MDVQASVRAFHEATLIPVGYQPSSLSVDRLKLRLNLFDEFIELLEASGMNKRTTGFLAESLKQEIAKLDGQHQDIIEMADALGDIVVVAFGMAIEMGVDLNRILAEIMRANMSKLDENGKPLLNVCTRWVADDDESDETRAYCQHQLAGEKSCSTPEHWVKPDDPYGKVLKASGYRGPDIKQVLDSQGPL